MHSWNYLTPMWNTSTALTLLSYMNVGATGANFTLKAPGSDLTRKGSHGARPILGQTGAESGSNWHESNIFCWFDFALTPMKHAAVYSVLSECLWKQIHMRLGGGIRTHDFHAVKAKSNQLFIPRRKNLMYHLYEIWPRGARFSDV